MFSQGSTTLETYLWIRTIHIAIDGFIMACLFQCWIMMMLGLRHLTLAICKITGICLDDKNSDGKSVAMVIIGTVDNEASWWL